MPTETEIKAFISKEQYLELKGYFNKYADHIKTEDQTTIYFSGDHDLRIQKRDHDAKLCPKSGKVPDEVRKETEIIVKKDDFDNLRQIFHSLGFETEITWIRTRHKYKWDEITVCIDFTKGYGYIVELEKLTDDNSALDELKQKLKQLNIKLTPREEFEEKFKYYKKNWKTLIHTTP